LRHDLRADADQNFDATTREVLVALPAVEGD
jgi:hypothetical protein